MLGQQKSTELLKSILQRTSPYPSEVILLGKDEQLSRFANNIIHQNVSETNVTATVRVAVGQRIGTATTNDLTDAGLDRAVQTATAIAQLQPENPDFLGFPEPQPIPSASAFDQATAAFSPQERAHQVGIICRRADEAGLIASGAFSTGTNELSVGNSQGVMAYHRSTQADAVTVIMSDDSSGYSAERSWKAADLDLRALGDEAIEKALRGRAPHDLEPGIYTVVLEPYATQDFLTMLGFIGMGAMSFQEGRGWMNGRIGQQIMAPSISIWDDGLDPASIPLPFDFEGMPRKRVDLVKDGVAMGVVYDTATARKEKDQATTGHALPPAMAANMGPIPMHLFMAPGDATLDKMIASTQRGLLITRFHYTRPVHPRDAIITGLTRDGAFLIENGEIAYPVHNLRYTQSYLDALAKTEMIGEELKSLGSFFGIVRAPALKLAEFNFTGATQF